MTTRDPSTPDNFDTDRYDVETTESEAADRQWVDAIMQAMRTAETGNDYRYQQTGRGVNGTPEPIVGAYAIPLSRWAGLAGAAGIPGADWRDRAAQDYVVRETLKTIHNDITSEGEQLSPEKISSLVSVGFKYGTHVAKWLVSNRTTEPQDISKVAGLEEVGKYVEVIGSDEGNELGYMGGASQPYMQYGEDEQAPQPEDRTLTKAQDRIRDTLQMMAKAQKPETTELEQAPTTDENVEAV